MAYCVEVEGIDLALSMYVSFLLPLFRMKSGRRWVKVLGVGAGLELVEKDYALCCEGGGCRRLYRYLTGAWCIERCRERLSLLKGALNKGVLETAYRLTIVANPFDAEAIAIAAFLSRRTSWLTNTVRWVREIVGKRLSRKSVEETARRYGSYQLYQLAEIYDELAAVAARIASGYRVAVELRKSLLGIKHVGPKVADSILLFTAVSSRVAPFDTHLAKLLKTMRLPYRQPSKNKCLRHGVCDTCTLRRECGSGIIVSLFGDAAGLVQSAAYAYYSLGGGENPAELLLKKLNTI